MIFSLSQINGIMRARIYSKMKDFCSIKKKDIFLKKGVFAEKWNLKKKKRMDNNKKL